MGETVDWLTASEQWSGDDGIPARLIEHIWYWRSACSSPSLIAFPVGLLTGHPAAAASRPLAPHLRPRASQLGVVMLMFRIEPLSNSRPVMIALVVIAIPPILVYTVRGDAPDRPGTATRRAGWA